MSVVTTDPRCAAIDAAVNALQAAVLLAGQIETDQAELLPAIDRAGTALATLKPEKKR